MHWIVEMLLHLRGKREDSEKRQPDFMLPADQGILPSVASDLLEAVGPVVAPTGEYFHGLVCRWIWTR